MNDNIILYAISLICIILLLIEWIFISHKKCSINAIVFVGYSFPLYYLMIYKGAGGAAFTWWFYLVLFTSSKPERKNFPILSSKESVIKSDS